MEDESTEERNSARLRIMELANMVSVPMSLLAVVRLNVADAVWQAGANSPLSASEILSLVNISPAADPENLQRILRLLSSYGVFSEHLHYSSPDVLVRKYNLTDVGKTLVTDAHGLSYASLVLQRHQDALLRAWSLMHEAVTDPTTVPFVKANGDPVYVYYGKHPEMNGLMQKAMGSVSVPFMKAFLNSYHGFEGVETLVDVGGSAGHCLRMITHKYPGIQGVNFDLPEVVAKAPKIPGVSHVGGDMLKSIPTADAVFMKWVLCIWKDEECKQIMENCYKVLPAGGKLIACEPMLPKHSDDSNRTRALLENDLMIMTMGATKGKNRTEEEFKQIGLSAGFSQFKATDNDYFFTVLEFHK
ncbi:hypothetical protein K2173_002052 [Erythroxylum novogranatense]|uniref:Uncharacterized protein n=1 Tax=Erythroxylum novogranatense TaxID=1862640 RepID=A0AAV8SPN6_9ROSI|nr:hypothetical protein K2173_002052 [Erythroxylum novogranatense]